MTDGDRIREALEPLTKNGFGRVKGNGRYQRRCRCPFHDGKDYNFELHQAGFGVCYSRCGYKTIPELKEVLGIGHQREDSAPARRTHSPRREPPAPAQPNHKWFDDEIRRRIAYNYGTLQALNYTEAAISHTGDLRHISELLDKYAIKLDAEIKELKSCLTQ